MPLGVCDLVYPLDIQGCDMIQSCDRCRGKPADRVGSYSADAEGNPRIEHLVRELKPMDIRGTSFRIATVMPVLSFGVYQIDLELLDVVAVIKTM